MSCECHDMSSEVYVIYVSQNIPWVQRHSYFLLSCFRKGICRTAWKRAIMTTDLLPRKGLSVKETCFAEVH